MGVEDNTIDISFSDNDLTALTEAQICQTVETCFIYFTSSMVQDYSGNFVVPILLESAQLVGEYDQYRSVGHCMCLLCRQVQ